MKDGIRTIIFKELIKNIPAGTNKMTGFSKISDVVEKYYAEAYEQDCKSEFVRVFGGEKTWHFSKREYVNADTFEKTMDANSKTLFKTEEKAIQWAADNLGWKEFLDCTKWLIDNGYVREYKKPARFGERWYLGVTTKGWSVAHLYK